MILALARFVEALRGEGVIVSPAEVLDASRALEAVDIEHRDRFRGALRATLAKDRERAAVFERVFERFFAVPRSTRRKRGRKRGSGSAMPGPGRRSESSAPRTEPNREPQSSPAPTRRAETRGKPSEPWRIMLRDSGRSGERRRGKLRRVRLADRETELAPGPSASSATHPTHRDLRRPMPTERELEIAASLPKLIDEIRLRRSRRQRRHRRGALWTRRLFRDNLAHGGVPFVLPRRRPRRRRANVILLVDVSHSAARATAFFLWMAGSFLRPGRKVRIVLFVDRPVEATRPVAAWMRGRLPDARGSAVPSWRSRPGQGVAPGGESFAELLESISGLDPNAPSDYGRTLHALLHMRGLPSRDTVWVVLGDGRTNRFEALPWTFEELTRRARSVIWLVPEPRARWGTGDSALAGYLPYVDTLVEAWDLQGLSRGLDELLRRL